MKTGSMLLVAAAAVCLAGCEAANGFGNRYGPDPAMPSQDVAASVNHQDAIMTSLREAARCSDAPVNLPDCNYATTLVGFNFVDEQCDAYLHELFAIDKERDRAKNVINGAGLLTNTILAVSPASKITMAIAAHAFGLSSSYVDVATDSYLYKTDTGVIYKAVEEMQLEYRTRADKDFRERPYLFEIEPQAYGAIRGYLRLCMPPTIQSKMTSALANATAAAPPNTKGPQTLQPVDLTAPKQ